MEGVPGINGGGAQGRGAPDPDNLPAVVPVEAVQQSTPSISIPTSQIDPVGQGSRGNGGIDLDPEAAREVAERIAGELPRMLAFGGTTVASFAITSWVEKPKHLAAHKYLPVAYCMALFLLFCFGAALMVMSVWASGDPPRRAAVSKTVMWATLAPLLLVLSLGALGMN